MAPSHFVQLILPSRYCSRSSATRRVCHRMYVLHVHFHLPLSFYLSFSFCTCYTLRTTRNQTSDTEPERKNAFHTKFTFMNRLTTKWRPEIKIILVQLHIIKKYKWNMKVWEFTCSNMTDIFSKPGKVLNSSVCCFVLTDCDFIFIQKTNAVSHFFPILLTNWKTSTNTLISHSI